MTSIPNNAFVFTVGLLCHGLILYENSHYLHNSRIISTKHTKLGCPVFFSSIDNVIENLHTTFYTDLSTNSQEVILKNHKNMMLYPLFYEKLLYYNPNSSSEATNIIFNIITKENHYKDGIYLFSIHKKTMNGLENIPFGDNKPLNLMLTESWNILDTIFKINTNLDELSSEPLNSIFNNIESSYDIQKLIIDANNMSQEIIDNIDKHILSEKQNAAQNYKLHIKKNNIVYIKLSTIIDLLSTYNPMHLKNMNFFNIYDFTCNGFSSLIDKKDEKKLLDKFDNLDIDMQISYGGSGKYVKSHRIRSN